MTALERIHHYLDRLRFRFRLSAGLRGSAFVAILCLALTVAFTAIADRFEFPTALVWLLRICLYLSALTATALLLVFPIRKVTRHDAVKKVEQAVPDFRQTLLTVAEMESSGNPFHELVAEEGLRVVQQHPPESVADNRSLTLWGAGALSAAAILLWLIAAGPGHWGYGASLLWTLHADQAKRPSYGILVSPGNKVIRRRSDQTVEARLQGFSTPAVVLHARYGNADKWQSVTMQRNDGAQYRFAFSAVSDSIEYWVQAGHARSEHYRIGVKDLPNIQRVRISLHFPGGLGLTDVTDESGGDIRAVIGTRARVSILTDRPLEQGALVFNGGKRIDLTRARDNWSQADVPVERDGTYHVVAMDNGEAIRMSEDFFIEAKKDEPPSVRLSRPGHDPRVSPIEEVPVTVEASDDFGVHSLALHYSVNGEPEQVTELAAKPGKEATGKTTLYLENFKLSPGDVVSLYATAKDSNTQAKSDMIFAQAEPFDYKFSQSQQSGGGGGGAAADQNRISDRQKEIIAATFNQFRGGTPTAGTLKENAQFLADTEGKLSAQAKTLAERMSNRELSGANEDFENFSKLMTTASSEMGDAVVQLSPGKWRDALAPEQKALQSLLRAEALFRNIQVAFGQGQSGGSGGGAQRDLARMFDLELDTSKNQYETGQSAPSEQASNQQKEIDQALERLKALARRQQELAQQHAAQQTLDQRWQEEQLRREAEELRQQLQQLAQNSQNQSQSQSQSQSQGQQQASANSGGSSSQSSAGQAMRQAAQNLQNAEEEMRRAVSRGDAGAQERAAKQLAQAERELNRTLQQESGNSLEDLARRADEIAKAQRDVASRLRQMYGLGQRNESPLTLGGQGEEMPEMNDPDHQRFGYGYLRTPPGRRENRPSHVPTPDEKSIAAEKERLARELEEVQRGTQEQTQRLAGTAPRASSDLRKALSDSEQRELALRMEKNAQWIREGYGGWNLGMEDNVTAAVEQFSRDIRRAESTLRGEKNGNDGVQAQDSTAEALNQVRQLREQLEAARGQKNGQGQGQAGQANINGAIRDLTAYRGVVSGSDRALAGYLGGTLGYLRDLNADPGVLNKTIGNDAVLSLEKLEAELTRKLGQEQALGARAGTAEKAPAKYREAVAEYFKKLSQASPR